MHTQLYTHLYAYIIYMHTNLHSFKCASIFKYYYPKEAHKIQYVDCVKSVRIWSYYDPYSVQMQENTDQNNSEYGHFSRSAGRKGT